MIYIEDVVNTSIYDFEEHFRKYFGIIMDYGYGLCFFISK